MNRLPYVFKYRAGVSADGKLEAVEVMYYADCGYTDSCFTPPVAISVCDNVYSCDNWTVKAQGVRTNTPANTFCRSINVFLLVK